MSANGKALESFVAFVEETLVPRGFTVNVNQRIFDEDGKQMAEFDVQVQGKLGSTQLNWLIECRDRPASGPAPSAWIEQLVGRRERFHFNKVSAVSTTGFADAAVDYASRSGIELRELKETSHEEFSSWLALDHMTMQTRVHDLKHAQINVRATITPVQFDAFAQLISSLDGNAKFLRSIATDNLSNTTEAFIGLTSQNQDLWDGIEPNGAGMPVNILCKYDNDLDHFVVDTSKGPVRIESINFQGELKLVQTELPVKALKYSNIESSEAISETAKFEGALGSESLELEIHRIAGAEHMFITVKRG